MRVVVTGGAGFLGSHVCELLVDRRDEVVVLDNLSTGALGTSTTCRGQVHPSPTMTSATRSTLPARSTR